MSFRLKDFKCPYKDSNFYEGQVCILNSFSLFHRQIKEPCGIADGIIFVNISRLPAATYCKKRLHLSSGRFPGSASIFFLSSMAVRLNP